MIYLSLHLQHESNPKGEGERKRVSEKKFRIAKDRKTG